MRAMDDLLRLSPSRLTARTRGVPGLGPALRGAGTDAARRAVGRGGRVPARALRQGGRGGPARHGVCRGIRRLRGGRDAPSHRLRRTGAVRGGRRARLAHVAHDRRPAGRGARVRRAAATRPALHPGRRAHRGPGGDRAVGGLRRRGPQDQRPSRRRRFRRERREDLHHLRHARRFLHRRGADGSDSARHPRHFAAAGGARHARVHAHATAEDGLVGLGHRAPELRRRRASPSPT